MPKKIPPRLGDRLVFPKEGGLGNSKQEEPSQEPTAAAEEGDESQEKAGDGGSIYKMSQKEKEAAGSMMSKPSGMTAWVAGLALVLAVSAIALYSLLPGSVGSALGTQGSKLDTLLKQQKAMQEELANATKRLQEMEKKFGELEKKKSDLVEFRKMLSLQFDQMKKRLVPLGTSWERTEELLQWSKDTGAKIAP